MRELPAGTVTFLFTDIEGSTRLLHELGDGYAAALATHRKALRDAFAAHGGIEVDTQGDAFFVAFTRASDAIAAASEGQAALAGGPVRVRMGLHTGEPLVTDEGYVGIDVHRAARIAAAGHGGQVLLSQSTRDLLDSELEPRELGQHRLKDLTAPVRLYQLGDGEFPPLKVLFGTNLPVQPTPLVGRERELGETAALLGAHRVLTLTGPGGSGKTRLALQLAADSLEDFPDGVFWVPLQAVGDAALVEPAIARTLGAKGGLAESVGDRRMLLLLDNFEHVLDAADDVAGLVAGTPHAQILVTSREPLRIAAEQRYGVDPLPESDAVALFMERARAVDLAFEPVPEVREICLRLDGLPLAIELAAARLSVLDAAKLASRLEQRLPLLTGGARDAPERQRTLRATIEWSHDLLDAGEQQAFRRLGVFAGSFELDTAEVVCGATLETMASLVEKSLVRRWGSGRFGMLETIQEYARERLAGSGEADAIGRRHAEFFLALAQSAHLAADEIDLGQHHEIVIPEQDNLRAALDWALDGDALLGLRLAIALEQFWVTHAPYEGARRVESLLSASFEVPPALRARALRVLGGTTYIVGDFARGNRFHEESLEEFRRLGDEAAIAHMLHREAVEALRRGERARARAASAEALETNRRLGSPSGEAMALGLLADLEMEERRPEGALALARRSVALAAEVGFTWWQEHYLYRACEWSLGLGRPAEAEAYGCDALRLAHQIGDRQVRVYMFALLARAAATQAQQERAGVLWGALESDEKRGPVGQWEDERDQYAAHVLECEGPEFERGREDGRKLALDEAVEYALAVDSRP
ncbi:MAG: adenylate/guanylate cyclase domain-containing protein [Actinobacteria bacterium]|nr:MAG: adenylate/guanylate cyclase domain-containing protein [Actinomycetota bacterium]